MKFQLVLLPVFFITFSVIGQQRFKNLIESKSKPGPGTLVLKDGTELKGDMMFNDRTTLLSFYQSDDSVQLSANALTSFNYYDPSVDKQRIFYAYSADDTDNGAPQTFIFELLKQYTSFAVLVRRMPPDPELVKKTYGSGAIDQMSVQWITVNQDERVYLIKNDDRPVVFLEITYKKLGKDKAEKTDKRGKIINKKALDDVLGKNAEKVRKYAFENRISLHNKEDLLTALNYAELLDKEP